MAKTTKLGLWDRSVQECRVSGYPVIEINPLMPFKAKQNYRLSVSDPAAWNDTGTALNGNAVSSSSVKMSPWSYLGRMAYVKMLEVYHAQGEKIVENTAARGLKPPRPADDPDIGFKDYLLLAYLIHGYCNLNGK